MPEEGRQAAGDMLQQQISFLVEIDKLKSVFRQSFLADGSRKENDAEHSWHLAMAAILLAQHADQPVDVLHVIKMTLIHDLVEIDAGDVIVYGSAREGQRAKELLAADRIFGLLPAEQAAQFRAIWDEFEARQTPEARFAAALDRLLPILLNVQTAGKTWREHGITADRVRKHNAHIAQGSSRIWAFVSSLIDYAVAKGYLPEGPASK